MNDAEYNRTKAKISGMLTRWRREIGMMEWAIDAKWLRLHHPDDGKEFCTLAETTCDWRYRTARIEFSIPRMMERTDEQNERTILHELLHLLVNEMREKDACHEERVVTDLTDKMVWAREWGERRGAAKKRKRRKR